MSAIESRGSQKARLGVKTASSLSFSADELCLLSESLRMSQHTLVEESDRLAVIMPTTPLIERFRMEAERMADIRARIDA